MRSSLASEPSGFGKANSLQDQILHVTSPAPREVWLNVVKSDPDALVTQTPAWLDSICAMGNYADASRLYETRDGRQLVLPMVRGKILPPALATLASFPDAWGMGGLIASETVRAEEIAMVLADLDRQSALRISLRPNPLSAEKWATARPPRAIAIPRLAHVLDLEGGFEQVWTKRFTGTARTAVRKAEQSGLVVECDTSGRLVPVFYDLFSRSLDRWGKQQHEPLILARWRGHQRDPLRKFQLIAEHLGDACRVWVAWLNGQPAATILVLQGINASYTRGAMDKELAGPTRANYLLHKLAIEDACQSGCRYYHMGDSGASSALAQFKSRFGARAYSYAEYRLERLPITRIDKQLRNLVKRLIGFKDV